MCAAKVSRYQTSVLIILSIFLSMTSCGKSGGGNVSGGGSSSSTPGAPLPDNVAPSAPSGLALQDPSSSPGTDSTPEIRISGVVVGDTVKLFTDACTTQVGSATVSSGTTVDVTSSTLAAGATYTFYANSTDPAGNISTCSVATVSYFLGALGAFSISGIQGASDATSDAYLNGGLTPIVYWGSSTDATSYDVTVYESDGTTVKCATQNTASTNYDFSGCTLTAGSTYKANVVSKAAGYTNKDATNNLYSFVVNRAPTITTSGPWYVLSSGSIDIQAQYAVAPAVGTAADADSDTLTFSAVGAASAGTATNNSTYITYSPGGNTGAQTFTFTVSDGKAGTVSGTMTIHVVTAFTWTGGAADSAWNSAANWCGSINTNKTACANNGAAPSNSGTATHVAIFDGTCSSNCNATTSTGNYAMYGIKLNLGYTGTVTQAAGRTMTIGVGGFTQAAGTFTGGNSTMTFSGGSFALSGGVFTSTTGTLTTNNTWTISGSPTFNHNSGTIQFTTPWATNRTHTPGTVAYNNVTFNPDGGTVSLNSGTMTVQGNLVMAGAQNMGNPILTAGTVNVTGNVTAGPNVVSGTSTFTVRVTGNASGQTVTTSSSSAYISNLTIVAGTNNVTLASPLYLSYNATFTSFGTLTTPASLTLNCAHTVTCTYNLGTGTTYTNLSLIANGSTMTFGGTTVPFTGSLSANGGNYGNTINSGTLQFGGDIASVGANGNSGSAIIELTGNAAGQTVTTPSTSSLPSLKISAGANNVTLSGTVTLNGGLNVSSVGTLTTTGSTLKFNGTWTASWTITPGSVVYENVIFKGSNSTWNFGGNTMNVSGNLEYQPSNYGMQLNNGNIFLSGNLNVVTYAATGTAVIKLVGNAAGQTIGMSGTGAVPYLTVDTGANPSTALTANTRVTNLTLSTGNFLMSGFNLTNTTLALGGNTLTKGGGVLTVNGSIIGTGNPLFGGTINP